MKVLVLGSTGMLGHVLSDILQSDDSISLINVSYRNKLNASTELVDVRDITSVSDCLQKHKPDFVINCIGVLIGGSNNNPANAIYINAYFPHELSRLCQEVGANVITVSTDCVFSGNKGNYAIDEFRDADDVYGRSKALGELNNSHDMTIRTSIIGPELKINGEGLFDWFMRQDGVINGYTNAFWSGVTTLELSRIIKDAIRSFKPGLYQVSNSDKISKFDLLNLLNKTFKRGIEINPFSAKSVDKSLVHSTDMPKVSDYKTQIEEMHSYMVDRKSLYSKYFAE